MTSVQSLTAALRPASALSPSSNKNGSARSFVDFLHSPVALAGGQPRTYTFSALGMFGLARVTTMGESTDMQSASVPVASVPDAGEIAERGRMVLEGEAQAGVQRPVVTEAMSLPLARDPRAALRGDPAAPLQPLTAAADHLPLPPIIDAEPATEGAPAHASQGRPQGGAKAAPIHLLVSGTDGALQVIARSQDDTPEARLRLRRLIEDVAAEFGVRLDSFHLNGSQAERSFPSIVGGTHGDPAR